MRLRSALTSCLVSALTVGAAALAPAAHATQPTAQPTTEPYRCPPSAYPVTYSDALDKQVVDGSTVGGLSDLALDPVTGAYASTVDNHGTDPSRVWFYRDLFSPTVVDSLVLREPDGTPYTGLTADDEGLAFLPDGDLLVSSETEPSIRIFGRDGVQKGRLRVPPELRVAPRGRATANATLEGLSISPDGSTVVAAMEGRLAGDGADVRRMLVYTLVRGHYRLTKQVRYRVDHGFRVAEVQQYAAGHLLVLEAAYDPATGNAVRLYAAPGLDATRDGRLLAKREVADVTRCPSLGAPSKQTQANPLLDNYEGMTTDQFTDDYYRVVLVSDDNFNPSQITRLLTLVARLP